MEERYMVFQKNPWQGQEWEQETIELSLEEAKKSLEFYREHFPDNQYCIMTEIKEE